MIILSLHSRWTSGTLEFYDGTQTVFIIPLTDGTMTIGEDGEGIDVKFYGDTASSYMLWDESADKLVLNAAHVDVGGNLVADAFYAGTTATVGLTTTGICTLTTLTVVNGIVTQCS